MSVITQRSPKSPVSASKSPLAAWAKPKNRPCAPSNTVRGPRKPSRAMRAACRPTREAQPACRRLVHAPSARYSMMPPAMLPAIPSASTERFLSSPNAAETPRVAAIAPSTLVGWNPALWISLGATRERRQRGSPVAAEALARGEHRRNDHRARVHRPAFEGVVEILAVGRGAVDHRGVFGVEGAGVADRGAAAAVVDARDQCPYVVGGAGGHAQAGHVDQQIFAARADLRRKGIRRDHSSAVDQLLSDGLRHQRTVLTPASFRMSRILPVNSS